MQDEQRFRSELQDRRGRWAAAGATIAFVAVVGIGLLGAGDTGGRPSVPAQTDRTEVVAVASPRPTTAITAGDATSAGIALAKGIHRMPFGSAQVSMIVPEGWSRADATTIVQHDSRLRPFDAPTLAIHSISQVEADPCDLAEASRAVGPSVHDILAALVAMREVERVGPTETRVGALRAVRLKFHLAPSCPYRGGVALWHDADGQPFTLSEHGDIVVRLVELNGGTLVVTTHHNGASRGDVAELDAIVGTIVVERPPPDRP